MQRLDGLDAGFASFESPTMHLVIVGALVFDAAEGGLTFRKVRNLMAERIDLVPPFRTRLLETPFGVDHPLMVADPNFDLDYHVRRASIPSPGGVRELAAFVADVASRPLDRARPLWEFHVVEGLERGRLAVVAKLHHTIIDGVAGAELLAALFDLSPDPAPRPLFGGERSTRRVPEESVGSERAANPEEVATEVDEGGAPAGLPNDFARWRRAIGSLPGQFEAVTRALSGTVQSAGRLGGLRSDRSGVAPPLPFRAPRTSINRSISPHRRAAVAELPMREIRKVCEFLGGTANDVVLACSAGALRSFFATRGEVHSSPLVALVPVSVRTESDKGVLGNRVSATLVSLEDDVEDPVARLAKIRAGSVAAKQQCQTIGAAVFAAWSEAAVPALATRVSRLLTNFSVFDHLAPPFNVIVSNVPGPDVPLYLAGSRLVGLYPFGPLIEGVGVNITVFSYLDTIHVGVLGCWDLVPDVEKIADEIRESLDELVLHANRRGRPIPWWHSELPA